MLLSEKQKIILTPDSLSWIRQAYQHFPLQEALLNHEVAIDSRQLTFSHQDPVDRFLAATAQVYDRTLVTADNRLLQSQEFATLPNT